MQQLFLLFSFVSLFFIVACNNTSTTDNSTDQPITTDSIIQDNTVVTVDTNIIIDKTMVESEDRYNLPEGTVIGLFEEAIVYAGSIDFAFNVNGKTKLFRVESELYYKIEDGKKVKGYDLPKDLIDPSEDLEGVPGGNPKLIGKKFEITNKEGMLKIVPVK